MERVAQVGARYSKAKDLLDDIAKERRAAVTAALNAKAGSVSEIARRAGMTREQVARLGEGVTTGRDLNWRAEKRARQAATASDDD